MQRFFTSRMLVVTFTTLFSLTAVTAAQGNEKCSNATLKGSYGLHATGTIIGVGDFAAVGRFTFDGKGNLTGKLFSRVAGNNVEPPEFTGTYSVSPDCTMTDTFGPPINSTHVSVIVNGGNGCGTLYPRTAVGPLSSPIAELGKHQVVIMRPPKGARIGSFKAEFLRKQIVKKEDV